MCGLVGYWNSKGTDIIVAREMADRIRHRGPDDEGIWQEEKVGLVFAHRRLAIVDISAAGHQPMTSPCGRYTLVYNGEIYNHQDLRAELSEVGGDFKWLGHSDTETLLAAFCYWGVEKTLRLLNGMFAFALWDKSERCLFLARDRMGEKPLYYGRNGDTFLFGSELKALKVHPAWQGEVNRDALALFMRHSNIPSPWTIYRGINKLPPAHFIVVRHGGQDVSAPKSYWNLSAIVEQSSPRPGGDVDSYINELNSLLRDAIRCRMVADVPLGAFLSGGIDSTTIVALMQAQSSKPVKTFTIGFHEKEHNEATHAQVVAEHLGTDHTELYVTPAEAMAVIPKLPTIWDEPFSDSSQIPTFLVSQLTRQHVTVSLSGDGGDELFCGYNRYVLGYQIWKKLCLLPSSLRKILSWGIANAPAQQLNQIQRWLPGRMQVSSLSDRLPKLAEVLSHRNGQDFYRKLITHWKDPDQIVLGACEPKTLLNMPERQPNLPDLRELMMYLDMMTYLPDDILTKVDRASMAVSLEARVPMLDHRLVEFAWRLPMALKYRNGQGKWLLRQVLYRYVPKELMERPKMGFGVPIEHWLRGPLREWAEDLLAEKRLKEDGFFDPTPIRKMWQRHVVGKCRCHYHLWDVLMFQAWLMENRS